MRVKNDRGESITDKDMSVLREGDSVRTQHKKTSGVIRDYSLTHHVSVHWDLNKDAIKDKMFRLKVGDNEVIVDAEEMMRYLRWI